MMTPTLMVFVIPCSGKKLDHAAPAEQLYTGTMFRMALPIVRTETALTTAAFGHSAVVRVLSARHGLIAPAQVIEPYDVRMDELRKSATDALAQLVKQQLDRLIGTYREVEICALLPRAYLTLLKQAAGLLALPVTVTDLYTGCRGVGDQRQVLASIGANHKDHAPHPRTSTGDAQRPQVAGLDYDTPKPGERSNEDDPAMDEPEQDVDRDDEWPLEGFAFYHIDPTEF